MILCGMSVYYCCYTSRILIWFWYIVAMFLMGGTNGVWYWDRVVFGLSILWVFVNIGVVWWSVGCIGVGE